jgi:citrate synthase
MSDKKASLTVDGIAAPIELAVYSGSIGPDVIDVGGLTAQGMFTYDPGFVSTAACESQITYIPITLITWKPATCCCTANCLRRTRN